jgi:hypothetical protein
MRARKEAGLAWAETAALALAVAPGPAAFFLQAPVSSITADAKHPKNTRHRRIAHLLCMPAPRHL